MIDNELLELGLKPIINAANLLVHSNNEYAMIRHVGFGASEASILIGINPYNTLDDLRNDKITLKLDPEISKKDVVRKGKDLEDVFMKKASNHFNIEIHKPQLMYKIDNESRLTVNFDGVTELSKTFIPVEIKMCSIYGRKHYDFSKSLAENINEEHWTTDIMDFIATYMTDSLEVCGFPQYYYAQLQQQMLALHAPFGILAVMDDKEWIMHYFVTKRNDEMIKAIQLSAIKNRDCLHPEEEIISMIPENLRTINLL